MKIRHILTFVPLFALTLVGAAAARAEQVTLAEALQTAMADRPLVRARAAESEAARQDLAAAASRYLPRLSLNEQYYRTNEPGGSLFISLNQQDLKLSPTAAPYNNAPTRQDFETRLTLMQPLYDADISYGEQRAAVNVSAATATERQGRESAAIAVLNAYLDVQMHQDQVTSAEAALTEAEQVLAIADQRQQAELGLKADTLRARSMVNRAQLNLLTSNHALQLSKQQLAFSMGRPDGEVDIAAPLPLSSITEPTYAASLQRGDLKALELKAEEASLAARQEQAGLLPKANLQASYMLHDDTMPFGSSAEAWSLTAGLRWEFFDGFERRHRTAGADARRLAAVERHLDRSREVRLALEKARLQNEQAAVAVELAQSNRAAAQEAKTVILQRYQAGLAPLSDLLAIQTELERARSSLVEAETNQLRARAMAHYQQGTLLKALSLSQGEDSR